MMRTLLEKNSTVVGIGATHRPHNHLTQVIEPKIFDELFVLKGN